jgi:hypothetical protein
VNPAPPTTPANARPAGLTVDGSGICTLTVARFAVTLKASTAGKVVVLAAAAPQKPDPHPLNNISVQQISITR